jgi:tetratricopeptide (TPR) repeat protein
MRFIGESQALDSSFERVWNCAILAMAHHRLGEADLARQKLNEATVACNQRIMDLLRSGPGLPTHWWDMLESSLHYREAKTLIDGFPPADDPRLWVVRGRNLVAVGRDEQAAVSFSKALELQPTFEAAQADLVHAYQRLGRQDKVLAECLREVELEPKNAIALNRLAWVLANCPEVQFRDPGRAVVLAQQAISLVPVSAQGMYWNTLGVAHYRAGEWEAAGTALHKSLELRSGGNLNDWFFLAMAHWKQDQGDLARRWFAHAVQQMATTAPDNEDLRRYRAEAALLLSLPETSASTSRQLAQDDVALYTLVLKADRDAGWAFMLRGSALAELEQWQQATADFAEATRRRPDDAKLWYDHAAAHLGAGNMEAYREVRAGMLRRFGKTTYPGIASLLLYISIVLPADASESAQLMQWGNLASRPGNEGLLGLGYERVHGAALYRAGKYGEAIEILDRAARLFPRRAWDWLFLAMAYHHLGKPALAQEHLKNGLKWIEQAHQQKARGDRNAWLRWPEQVEVEQLRREAESLIQSTPGLRK